MVHDAIPLATSTACAPHPLIVDPASVKLTVPPSGIGVIVAVYVTGCPTDDGDAGEDASPVAVDAFPTACVTSPNEVVSFRSPE